MSDDDEPFEVTAVIVTMLVVFSVFGSAGNALVLYVFSTAKDDLVSTLFIIVLAVVDFSTCLVIIPFTIVVHLVSYQIRFDLFCKLYQFLITSNIPFSALIMTAIAVDRYFCICHPFARLLTLRRARVVVLVLAAFASLLGIIGALTHSVYQRDSVTTNITENNTVTQPPVTLPVAWLNQSGMVDGKTVYTGYCVPTDLILSTGFALAFQRCYTSIFVVCLGIVVVLYFLIYRSVLRQRHKRQKMKATPLRSYTPKTTQKPVDLASSNSPTVECEVSAVRRRDNEDEGKVCPETKPEAADTTSVSEAAAAAAGVARDKLINETRSEAGLANQTTAAAAAAAETARRDRIANIKTAAMLFVVTLVFAVSFFPSLAMTVHILPYNMTIFYMYFANNVANPIIYSFMNSNFRKRLVSLFCK